MLSSQKQRDSNIETSQQMLNLYVENFPLVFGRNSVSYNVHGLLHVRETLQHIGAPIAGSSYAFENYLQTLKKFVRCPSKNLQQVYRIWQPTKTKQIYIA